MTGHGVIVLRMVGKTPAQRKAEERARREMLGVKRLEFYLPPELHDKVKKYVRRLLKQRSDNQ